MTTTTLVVELLIIGFEVVTWVALLFGVLFGLDWIPFLGIAFEKAGISITVALFGLAYLIGIIVDEVCDALVSPWEERIWCSVQGKEQASMWDIQAYVVSYAEEAAAPLRYQRSRIKILRSSMFNLALTSGFALLLLWTRLPMQASLRVELTWFIGVTGLVMVGLTTFAYWRINSSYWKRVRSIYATLREREATEKNAPLTSQRVREGLATSDNMR